MNPVPETQQEDPISPEQEFTALAEPLPVAPARKKSLWQKVWNNKFLFYSILAHVLFGLIATALVVQTITAKRKLTFQGGPPSPNPSHRAMEHKVQMAQKQKTMSAPAQAKRITSTNSLAKVSLPSMPAMPTSNAVTPSKMAGMGGTGVGLGPSLGALGGGSSAGGGSAVPFFGLKAPTAAGSLQGVFYDLKQTPGRRPTDMNPGKYQGIVIDFVKKGWSAGHFANFFKVSTPLYNSQFFTPDMNADEGPKGFGVEKEVQPKMWVALYKGQVSPPESGDYYFVGAGDDVLFVRFNGKTVLNASWFNHDPSLAKEDGRYNYGWTLQPGGFTKSGAVHVEQGKFYPMEILVGEEPGGSFHFDLLIEKEGVTYQKDGRGNPILPIFRLAPSKLPDAGNFPPHAPDGPIWAAQKASSSEMGTTSFDIFHKSPSPAP